MRFEMMVARSSHQAAVLDRPPHREVVEGLKLIALDAEQIVEGIVEITSDSRVTDGGRLRLQDLTEQSRFPEQPTVTPRTEATNAWANSASMPRRGGHGQTSHGGTPIRGLAILPCLAPVNG